MELARTFDVFADYFQFVLMDENCEDDFALVWTNEALARMLALGDTSACPGTLRNVNVRIEVHVHASKPQVDLDGYDHAVSASLLLPTGQLVVMGCTDYLPEAARLEVPPGPYQLLYLATGIESITYESDPADDRYIVHLWPGPPREPALLKHWRQSARSRVFAQAAPGSVRHLDPATNDQRIVSAEQALLWGGTAASAPPTR